MSRGQLDGLALEEGRQEEEREELSGRKVRIDGGLPESGSLNISEGCTVPPPLASRQICEHLCRARLKATNCQDSTIWTPLDNSFRGHGWVWMDERGKTGG
jgi:hypothetical protein